MKLMALVLVGAALGFGGGYYEGKRSADRDWSSRAVTGVAVDCYDAQGNLARDEFAQYGGVTTSCAPGQTAKLHQSKP